MATIGKMNNLVLYKERQVRRVWHEEAWWFVILDVVAVLADSVDTVAEGGAV